MSFQFVAYVPSARGAGWGRGWGGGICTKATQCALWLAFVSLVNAQLFVFKN